MLNDFITENNIKLSTDNQVVIMSIRQHLRELIKSFRDYFPCDTDINKEDCMRNPFNIQPDSMPSHLSRKEKEQLIEIATDKRLQDEFKKVDLCEFWLRQRAMFSLLSDRAIIFMLPFTTSYLCEKGFSAMLFIKNNYRTQQTNLEANMRLKLSNVEPDIAKLCSTKQTHTSEPYVDFIWVTRKKNV